MYLRPEDFQFTPHLNIDNDIENEKYTIEKYTIEKYTIDKYTIEKYTFEKEDSVYLRPEDFQFTLHLCSQRPESGHDSANATSCHTFQLLLSIIITSTERTK